MAVGSKRGHARGRGVATAVAVILVGLVGRAVIDKILALRTTPESIAFWAQLQSVAELVVGVTIAGLGPGLTVLVTQSKQRAPRHLLRAALLAGLCVSASAMLALVWSAGSISRWFTASAVAPSLIAFAAVTGCCMVVPSLLGAYWLGRGQRGRILWLNLATMLVMVGAAYFAPPGAIPPSVLVAQLVPALIVGGFLLVWLREPEVRDTAVSGADVRLLLRYIPIGLSNGILTPLAILVARSAMSDGLSWNDAGNVQALWRASEWITYLGGGIASLVFLPRFSAAWGSPRFATEVTRALIATLAVSGSLLLALWFVQGQVLVILYDARFAMPDRAAALFLLGDWLRLGSWVLLNALYAMQRTNPVTFGELISMPLFAALLVVFSDGLTLERAGLLFALTYAIYFAFNLAAAQGWRFKPST